MHMTARSLFLLVASAVIAAGSGARAHAGAPIWQRVVLVELFTSQGCSSCPPAEAFVRDLPRLGYGRDKVLALTFHVNYWDDLGWKDPFAAPAFTARQDWYARSGRLRAPGAESGLAGLYTPQMIVAGAVHFSGQQRGIALAEFARAAARPPELGISADAKPEGDAVTLDVRLAPRQAMPSHRDWRLVVALAARSQRTQVLRGENRGETLEEAAVVRALSDRLPVTLTAPTQSRITLRKPAGLAWTDVELVAFVQSEVTREVAGAAALSLNAP